MNGTLIDAKSLREKAERSLESNSGIYKWWAKRTELKTILDVLGVTSKDFEKEMEQKYGLYCIYVGKADSLEKRLKDNHVNGRAKSTLRKSIGGVLLAEYGPENLKERIDDFIDKLKIEYELVDLEKLKESEKKEIGKEYLRVFNGNSNGHKELRKLYGDRLTDLRKKFDEVKMKK